MSMDSTKELIFQNEMIAQMEAKGWVCGKTDGYDRERALYSQDALTFVQTTQPQEWEKFAKIYPTDTERHFLDALVAQLKKRISTPPMFCLAPTARSACCVMVSKAITRVFPVPV
jgi:type I restriction enzyme R subunit